jgi:20S proteasome alpha/beta subunit
MTLVVALSCKDGIVMASDGQATGGSTGGPIRMPIQKIFKINTNVLFGAAGNVGIIQKVREFIQSYSTDLENDLNSQLMEAVRKSFFGIYRNEIDRHRAFYQGTPQEDIRNVPLADVLLCKFSENQKMIWHIYPDCSDERLEEIGYGCSGSGDIFAHTLLKNYLKKKLTTEEGKLIVYRVIREAIEIGAFGLGEPINIWTMNKEGIKEISKEELLGLGDACNAWKAMESEIFERIVGDKK